MDRISNHEKDSDIKPPTATPVAVDSGSSLMRTFLFAMPGALDVVICDDLLAQRAKSA